MQSICPMPIIWRDIHERLLAATAHDPRIPRPPVPLILAGWVYTNDIDKQTRWNDTMQWARQWGLSHLIPPLEPDMMYIVESPTTYAVGPMGGPMYLEWNHDPRPTVSDDAAAQAVTRLLEDWTRVAGPVLSAVTRPIRLTGRKRRRLLVDVQRDALPPWGTWTALAAGAERRSFTVFRASINQAIRPLEVDHIDFVHELSKGGV